MERVRITNVAVAHPPLRLSQADAARGIAAFVGDARRTRAIARGTAIETRAVCLPPRELKSLTTIQARNDAYRRLAPPLAFECAANALGESPREAVHAVVSSSCTGYALPGWGAALVPALELPPATVRLPVTESGCAGGVAAISHASELLRHRPGRLALAAATELCTLSFNPLAGEGALAASLLFGDGAGAALLCSGPGPGLEIVDSLSWLVPGTAGDLGFDLTDSGFSPVLARELPRIIPEPTGEAVSALLARNHLVPSDIGAWLLHPGGARILSRLEQHLSLSRAQSRWSWDSMGEFGNTSSAAIFDVLRRYLQDDEPEGFAVVAAFGPGVSIELLLVRRTC